MILTIRRARASDRKAYDWQHYQIGLTTYKPYVVTINGEPFVAFGMNREVVWQNGKESVADLVRIAIRYFDAMQQLDYDLSDIRTDRSMAESKRRVQEAMRKHHAGL